MCGWYLPHTGCYESALMLRGSALVVECRRSRVARFILLGRHPLPPRLQAAQCIQSLCKQILLPLLSFNCPPTAYYQNFCSVNFFSFIFSYSFTHDFQQHNNSVVEDWRHHWSHHDVRSSTYWVLEFTSLSPLFNFDHINRKNLYVPWQKCLNPVKIGVKGCMKNTWKNFFCIVCRRL